MAIRLTQKGGGMYRVELVFGHIDRFGDPVSPADVHAGEIQALRVFSHVFGGGQIQNHTGGYLTNDGRLLIEPCSVVWSYSPFYEEALGELRQLGSTLASLLRQETVMLVVVTMRAAVFHLTCAVVKPDGVYADGGREGESSVPAYSSLLTLERIAPSSNGHLSNGGPEHDGSSPDTRRGRLD